MDTALYDQFGLYGRWDWTQSFTKGTAYAMSDWEFVKCSLIMNMVFFEGTVDLCLRGLNKREC